MTSISAGPRPDPQGWGWWEEEEEDRARQEEDPVCQEVRFSIHLEDHQLPLLSCQVCERCGDVRWPQEGTQLQLWIKCPCGHIESIWGTYYGCPMAHSNMPETEMFQSDVLRKLSWESFETWYLGGKDGLCQEPHAGEGVEWGGGSRQTWPGMNASTWRSALYPILKRFFLFRA